MTYREFHLRCKAYERTVANKWQIARWLGLKVLEPHLSKDNKLTVFDLLTLPTDPSPEELKEMQQEDAKRQMRHIEEMKERYRKMGINV